MIHTTDLALEWLWQTTWQAALLAGVIAIITRMFRARLSPGAVSLLWMLVFVRLAMPVLPGSSMSIFALFEGDSAPAATAGWALPTSDAQRWAMPTLQISASPQMAEEPSRWMEYTVLAVWLFGACALIGHVIVSTIRFSHRLNQTARPADARTRAMVEECCTQRNVWAPAVLITDLVPSPAIFGVLHPRLLIPPAVLTQLSGEELRGIILHELEHLRRRHLMGDWVFMLIKAVHWFNPAAWWAHRQIRAARELICDQAVLARLDEQSSRVYGLTMLAMAGGLRPAPRGVPVAAFARDYKLLKQRIEAIATKRRYLTGLGIVVAIVLGAMFLTKPAPAQESPAPTTRPTTAPAQNIVPGDQTGVRDRRGAPSDAELLALLDRNLPEVRFDNIGFADVMEFMRDVTGTNIFVNWRALEQAGIDRDAPVTARLRDVKFSKALETILMDVAGGTGKLGFVADQGVITISTVEDLKKATTQPAAGAQPFWIPANPAPLRWGARDARRPQPVAEDAVVISQLDRTLPEVRVDAVGFADVIEFMRDVSGAKIFVNWRALEQAGLDRNAPITARLRDVKFSKALDTILRDVGGSAVRLGYSVDEGVITISTEADLASNVVTNVYDIQDLLMAGGRDIKPEQLKELTKAIITLVQDTVARESWRDNGGKVGAIRELNGQLIVTQTPDNQRNIARLIAQLRETRAIQISLSAKILELPAQIAATIRPKIDPPTTVPNTPSMGISRPGGANLMDEKELTALLAREGVTGLAAPRVTIYNGQAATTATQADGKAFALNMTATTSSDRKYVTISFSATQNGAPGKGITLSIPDTATALIPLNGLSAAAGKELWVAIQPTIIFQREQPQAGFPILNQQAPPAQQ